MSDEKTDGVCTVEEMAAAYARAMEEGERLHTQLTAARSEANSLRERVEEAFAEGYQFGFDDAEGMARCPQDCAWKQSDSYKALASPPGREEAEGFAEAIEGDDGWVADPEEGAR